jgi:hypothetical protein
MTTAENEPDEALENQAPEGPAPGAETPTRLHEAAAGIADAQAWKGQQLAKGWRQLVTTLRRRKEGGSSVS